jgi:dTDP-4-dehydrorhamnose reductase
VAARQRILLLGQSGRIGSELAALLPELGDVAAPGSRELDLTERGELRRLLRTLRPGIVVNAAAYTDVDGAEHDADQAAAVNAEAPGVLAREADAVGAVLVHYSTDFVFDGTKDAPYVEDDPPAPLGVYGRTKLEGERAIEDAGGAWLVLRTSWVYAADRESFVTRVLRWARERPTLRVVADRTASPTWCRAAAGATVALLRRAGPRLHDSILERRGVYHLAGAGAATQFEWAEAVLRLDPRREEHVVTRLLPAVSDDFPTPARRPPYSALDCSRLERTFGVRLRPWIEDLESALRLAGARPPG